MRLLKYKGYDVTVSKDASTGYYECLLVSPYLVTNDYASEYEMYVHKAYKEYRALVAHLRELRRLL